MSGITITADTWAGVTFARAIASANAGGGGPAAVFPRLTPLTETSTSAGVVMMFSTDDTRSRVRVTVATAPASAVNACCTLR